MAFIVLAEVQLTTTTKLNFQDIYMQIKNASFAILFGFDKRIWYRDILFSLYVGIFNI